LPQSYRTGSLAVRNHLECCLESQRRDHAHHFRRHGGVDAHIAESDALSLGGVVDVGIIANITSHPAKPVVLNLKLSPTMSAAQQSSKNPTAIAHRARHHRALHIGVASNGLLVPLIFVPGDVALMVVAHQHLPIITAASHAAGDHLRPASSRTREPVRPKT
jgi:hypothetical protein